MYTYKAKILRVIDGDTVEAVVDLGLTTYTKEHLRLYDIDCPELFRPSCAAEKEHAREAKAFVENLVLGKDVLIRTFKDKTGKYGRYIADILLESTEEGGVITLTDALKVNGFEKKETYEPDPEV